MPAHTELLNTSAIALTARLRKGDITPHDCLDALEARIAAVDKHVNALPTLCFDRAHKAADALTKKPVAERGLLCGLPVPIKDLSMVAGVRSTMGSPIFADHIPQESDVVVERLEAEGALIYAKSNTPEFGAGANTFNEVFGATLNPYDTTRSAAGSSGGAAAALTAGMAWLAHGSDMGGSLRNPASFCGVVGMRPTPGRVASTRVFQVDGTLGVEGPMARGVTDLALLFDAMCGDDPRDPLSKPRPAQSFAAAAQSGWLPRRVAYSPNLGVTPVDPEIAEITRRAAHRFADAGVIVEEAHPDFSEAHEAFQILRAQAFHTSMGGLLKAHRGKLKPEIIWNIEKGMALTSGDIVRATHQRATLMQRASKFFETYDLLLCPSTITAAFPIGERYLKACDGVTFETYIDWLAIVYAATLVCSPALSLPCGFTKAGLPVGLQIIGRVNGDARVIAGAKALEKIFDLGMGRMIEPRGAAG